jgi:hypothetical protein
MNCLAHAVEVVVDIVIAQELPVARTAMHRCLSTVEAESTNLKVGVKEA